MVRTKKWLVTLAAGGSTVGAVAALSTIPSAASPSKSAGSVPASASRLSLDAVQLARAVSEVNQLQTRILDLRRQLIADEKTPISSGGTQVLIERGASNPGAGNYASMASWQAQLQAEQRQLAQEQVALQSEKNMLDSDAAKLQTEQQQLRDEQQRMSTTTSTAPATHTTTGASGSTSTTETSGGTDN